MWVEIQRTGSASVIHEMHTILSYELLSVHARNITGRENLRARGWKYKGQVLLP